MSQNTRREEYLTENEYGPVQVTVKEIKESSVIIDMNHPLAGKKLIFDLEVVSVD